MHAAPRRHRLPRSDERAPLQPERIQRDSRSWGSGARRSERDRHPVAGVQGGGRGVRLRGLKAGPARAPGRRATGFLSAMDSSRWRGRGGVGCRRPRCCPTSRCLGRAVIPTEPDCWDATACRPLATVVHALALLPRCARWVTPPSTSEYGHDTTTVTIVASCRPADARGKRATLRSLTFGVANRDRGRARMWGVRALPRSGRTRSNGRLCTSRPPRFRRRGRTRSVARRSTGCHETR